MAQSPEDLARGVARRIEASTHDPALGVSVEAELQGGAVAQRFDPFSLTIALAGLIVSASKAAWDIYRDVKKDRSEAPDPNAVRRRLRLVVDTGDAITPELRDEVFDAVIDEMTRDAS